MSPRRAVRFGEPFVLSCSAVGSPRLHFHWFKDGILVLGGNSSSGAAAAASASRHVLWSRLLPLQARDHHTSLFGADSAKAAHAGIYTCRATDGDAVACRSLRVQVWTPPLVIVRPLALSVARVSCILSRANLSRRKGNIGSTRVQS